jgi:amphi-Trp domain-containing protein
MVAKVTRGWFIIIYKMPAKPSTARVTIWKKVRELGSLALQQSVYILPNLPKLKGALNHFQSQIQQFGGECKVLEVAAFEESQEKETIAEFNKLRDQEYAEIIDEGQRLLQEIARERGDDLFNFAEALDIEKRFLKFKEWYEAVTVRDFFAAGLREAAAKAVKECKSASDAFSRESFSREQAAAREKAVDISAFVPLKPSHAESEKQFYNKEQLVARLSDIISNLENDALRIGSDEISFTPESAVLEMKYKKRSGRQSLSLEIEW